MNDTPTVKFSRARLKSQPNEAVFELLNAVLAELNERAPLFEPLREIRFLRTYDTVFARITGRITDVGSKKDCKIEFPAPPLAEGERGVPTIIEVIDRAGFVSCCRLELTDEEV